MPTRTTAAWFRVYIVYPLAPAVVNTVLRYIIIPPHQIWKAVGFSDVALSMGILSLFLVQAILTRNLPLEDEDGKQFRYGIASEFQLYTLLSFALFIIVSVFDDLEPTHHDILENMPLSVLYWSVSIISTLTIIRALYAQRAFKLVIT